MSESAPPEARAQRRDLLETTLLLLPFQLIFRGGEAVLPVLVAYWFGSTLETDVYNFAWAFFMFAGSLIFAAYHDSALVPILTEARLRDRDSIRHITGSLLAHTWTLGGALAAGVACLALGWFAIRYSGAEFRLAALMVPAFALQLVLMSTKTFFAAVASSHHTFKPYPLASATSVATMISIMWFGRDTLGILAVPIGAVCGELVAATFLALVVVKYLGVVPKFTFERPPAVKRFAQLAISEVGGGAVTRINPVVDQLLAGLAGVAGGPTLLRLSNDVASLPTSLLQATFLSVLLAHLAEDYANRDFARVRATVGRAVGIIFALLALAALAIYAVRGPLLRLVFLHGKMNIGAVNELQSILPYHLVGLASFGALLVLARANVAVQNSRIMFGMGVLNASMNVVFNLALLPSLGVRGVALATSIVHTIIAIVFWFRLQRRLRELTAAPIAELA